MKNKIKDFCKVRNEDILMIVLAFTAFSFGIWGNYRQLWLQSIGFNLIDISKVLSIALICSAIISFVISIFSTKVKVKNVIMLSMIFRAIALSILLFNRNPYVIKTCMLLCIMCEVIFSISFYPLLSTVNKSDETYKKHVMINYLAKDMGIISCGLLIGVVVGKIVFDLNSCLFLSLISCLLGVIALILFTENKTYKKRNILPFRKAFKNLFKSKINNYYLFGQFVMNISYGIIFGLMMLVLTNYLNFQISFASIFIIGCNVLGSLACSLFIKFGKNISVSLSVLIKYGSRVIAYLVAFITNNYFAFLMSIIIAYVTSRVLEDKVNGTYIRRIDTNSQFLFGNIRYFVLSIGEGVGTYLAGYLLQISFRSLFLGGAIFTIFQIIMFLNLDRINRIKCVNY